MRSLFLFLLSLLCLPLAAQSLPDSLPAGSDEAAIADSIEAFPTPADSVSTRIATRLDSLLDNDPLLHTTQLGLYVYDLTAARPLYARGERQRMRPASCQKIVTAVAALCRLGTAHRVTTRLTADSLSDDSIQHAALTLAGGFDPLFNAEDLRAMFFTLRERGIDSIAGDIRLDDSMTDTVRLGIGWCWDDDNPILTPLLYDGRPLTEEDVRLALSDIGIAFGGKVVREEAPASFVDVAATTRSIDSILTPMMKDSENLFAEALFYHLAAAEGTPHAGRKRAETEVERLLEELRIPGENYRIADGSGLSLYNYTTAKTLVKLLRHAYEDPAVFRHLLPSLPVAGTDGTLKKRMRDTPAADNVQAKTGTLSGVASLAGYLTTAHGHRLAFAILNQGMHRNAPARAFQDKVCRILCE